MYTIKEIIDKAGNLPASEIAETLNNSIERNNCVVVTAPPGAGKSTLLPLTMLAGTDCKGKILILEPRRIAAKQIAKRMADILGEPVGKTIGYRVRFENKVSNNTRIEVITEGILTRIISNEPTLDGVSAIVFDEFHERSINSDLALALTRESQQLVRNDLKIVIMSATIDTDEICTKLQAPLIESRGKMFPVKIVNIENDNRRDISDQVSDLTVKAHREHEGDILVFLPGQAEILRCKEQLADALSPTRVLPLYSNLPFKEQQRAIAPSQQGERKVVLATSIAETSITIEGVRIVIDSGLCRRPIFDPALGMSRLETTKISQDMATQRAGRAGRVAPGTCFRLWSRTADHLLDTQRRPEIIDTDLAPLLLATTAFGESNIYSLPWLTPPPSGNIKKAKELLVNLGAVTPDGKATFLGRQMNDLPCHPRISSMILGCKSHEEKSLACDIAALLEEKDPFDETAGTDMYTRVSALRASRKNTVSGIWKRIARIAEEYRKIVKCHEDNSDTSQEECGELIARAYPERIATATDSIGGFRMANGNMARLETSDNLSCYTWIAIARANSTSTGSVNKVFLAARLNPEDIHGPIVKEIDNISWDNRLGRIVSQHERRIGKLLLDCKPLQNPDKEHVDAIICNAVAKDGLSMLDWNCDKLTTLQNRIATVSAWHPELDIPDISTENMMKTAGNWLPLYLEDNGHVRSTAAELKKIDLAEVFWNTIPYELQLKINSIAPTHCTMPTGSRIRINYHKDGGTPTVSVRLQECFGLTATPCADSGKHPLLMELLSPGFKPVQLTQDLQSFWKTTYFDVRKEMRRRYPKHYWPENPLEAEPTRGIRKH